MDEDNEIEGVPDQYLDMWESGVEINDDGIRSDGTVEGYCVETYYRPALSIEIDPDLGCVRIVIDNHATNIETRIPIESLRQLGFKRFE